MLYSSTVTTKGQATIPAPIRDKLGLKPGGKVIFEEQDQDIILKNQSRIIDELYGSLKTNIKWNKKKAYDAVGKMLAQRYIKTLPKSLRPKLDEAS